MEITLLSFFFKFNRMEVTMREIIAEFIVIRPNNLPFLHRVTELPSSSQFWFLRHVSNIQKIYGDHSSDFRQFVLGKVEKLLGKKTIPLNAVAVRFADLAKTSEKVNFCMTPFMYFTGTLIPDRESFVACDPNFEDITLQAYRYVWDLPTKKHCLIRLASGHVFVFTRNEDVLLPAPLVPPNGETLHRDPNHAVVRAFWGGFYTVSTPFK